MNRSVTVQLWIIGALVPLLLMFTGEGGRYDFAAFWVASKQAITGDAGGIYDTVATKSYADLLDLGGPTIFPYPPHALFFFMPFVLLPYIPAYFAWNAATAALFYWAAKPILPARFPALLCIVTPAALASLDFGQTGLLFGALWLLAFRGRWAAVSLLTFKPHLGFLSIFSLTSVRAFLCAAVLASVCIGISIVLFGGELWWKFLLHTRHHAAEIGTMKRWLFAGVTPAIGYGFWGWLPFAAAGGLLLAKRVNVFTASTASFLISPYGFHYDMTVACLGLGLLAHVHWENMPVHHRLATALGFLSPAIAVSGAWWVPPILLWSLWVQVQYQPGLASERSVVPRQSAPTDVAEQT